MGVFFLGDPLRQRRPRQKPPGQRPPWTETTQTETPWTETPWTDIPGQTPPLDRPLLWTEAPWTEAPGQRLPLDRDPPGRNMGPGSQTGSNIWGTPPSPCEQNDTRE